MYLLAARVSSYSMRFRKGDSMTGNEIAKLAGVSRSTVSRVINNYSNVPDETRRKVIEIMERYDYLPNAFAQSLAGKAHNTIGLFIVGIVENDVDYRIYQNNYFAPYLEIITDELNSKGFYTLVSIIYSKDEYAKIKQAYRQKRIDGCIVIGTEADIDIYNGILHSGCPLSIIDLAPEDAKRLQHNQANLTVIDAMDYQGAYDAVGYLIGLGHREIGLLAGRLTTHSGRERYTAFMDAMCKHNLPVRDEYILKGEFSKNKTVREISRLMERSKMPTAIFSCNDDMAIAAIRLLRSKGIRVPEDISIVGFDDIAIASQIVPALTTVKIPVFEIAKKAAEAVICALENGSKSQSIISYPTELIVRDSCAHCQDGLTAFMQQ